MQSEVQVLQDYAWADAVADGLLVDVTHGQLGEVVRAAGLTLSLAISITAYARLVDVPEDDQARELEHLAGVLAASVAFTVNDDPIRFCVFDFEHAPVPLVALFGTDDRGARALTVVLAADATASPFTLSAPSTGARPDPLPYLAAAHYSQS